MKENLWERSNMVTDCTSMPMVMSTKAIGKTIRCMVMDSIALRTGQFMRGPFTQDSSMVKAFSTTKQSNTTISHNIMDLGCSLCPTVTEKRNIIMGTITKEFFRKDSVLGWEFIASIEYISTKASGNRIAFMGLVNCLEVDNFSLKEDLKTD
jgi:hypothetical protein